MNIEPFPPKLMMDEVDEDELNSEADALLLQETGANSKAEPTFSLKALKEFHAFFCEHEADGGMDMGTFVKKIGPYAMALHPGSTVKDVEILFKRIDANANGSVDWDEFATFLMMNDVKGTLRMTAEAKSRDFALAPTSKGSAIAQHPAMRLLLHKESMHKLVLHPRVNKYYSGSMDGMVKQWSSETLRHERTLQVSANAVTDMTICPYYFDALAVLCMDKTVSFYSADSGELMRVYVGDSSQPQPTSRHRGNTDDDDDDDDEYLRRGSETKVQRQRFALAVNREDADTIRYTSRAPLFGQVETCVPVLKHFNKPIEYDAIKMTSFGRFPRGVVANYPSAITTMKLLGETAQHISLIGFDNGYLQTYPLNSPIVPEALSIAPTGSYRFHWDRITKIIPIPELELLLTSSDDGMIHARNLERLNDVHTLLGEGVITPAAAKEMDVMNMDTSIRGHTHRVITMDWNYEIRMILSCAPEKDALLWSPYIPKPMGKLDGQKGRLLDVQFIKDTRQAMTLSDDRTIRIFDLRTLRVVQTLEDSPAVDPLLTARYDDKRDHVVLGSTSLRVWGTQQNALYNNKYSGHRRPVIGLAVSRQFRQLITADSKMIIVWELSDRFEPTMRWEVPAGIVDICLDGNGRRLIVATVEGTTLIYNYVNGQLLKTCQPSPGREECTSLTFGVMTNPRVAALIVSTHEEGVTSVYVDDDGGEAAPLRDVMSGEHATCVAIAAPSNLVIGDRGGIRVAVLSETSSLATPLQRLPLKVTSRGCKSAIYPGQLVDEPIPATLKYLKERDQFLFGDVGRPSFVDSSSTEVGGGGGGGGGGEDEALDSRQMASLGVTEHVVVMRRSDPQIVITGSSDGLVQFWDIRHQTERFRFRATVAIESITAMVLDQFENKLAIGDNAGYVSIFDVGRIHQANAIRRRDTTLVLSPSAANASRVAIGSSDASERSVVVTEDMISLVLRFRAHVECVSRLAFNDAVELNETYSTDGEENKKAQTPPLADHPLAKAGGLEDELNEDEDFTMRAVNSMRRRNTTVGIMKRTPLQLVTASTDSLTLLWDVHEGSHRLLQCFGDPDFAALRHSHAPAALRVFDTIRMEMVRMYVHETQVASLHAITDHFTREAESNGEGSIMVSATQSMSTDDENFTSATMGPTNMLSIGLYKPLVAIRSFQSTMMSAGRAFDDSTHDDADIGACIARIVSMMVDPPPQYERMLGVLEDGCSYYALIDKRAPSTNTNAAAAAESTTTSASKFGQGDVTEPIASFAKSKSHHLAASRASSSTGEAPPDGSILGDKSHTSRASMSNVGDPRSEHPDSVIEVLRSPRHGVCMSPGTCVDAHGLPENRPSSPKTALKGPAKFFTGAVSVRPRALEIEFSSAPPGEPTLFVDAKFEKDEAHREQDAQHLSKDVETNVCDVIMRLKVPKKESGQQQAIYRHVPHPNEKFLKPFSIFEFSEVPPPPSSDEGDDGCTASSDQLIHSVSASPLSALGSVGMLDLAVAEAIRQRDAILASLPPDQRSSSLTSSRSTGRGRRGVDSCVIVRSEEEKERYREQRSVARTPRPPPPRVRVHAPEGDEAVVHMFLQSFKSRASVQRANSSSTADQRNAQKKETASASGDELSSQPKRYQRQGGLLGELAWVARLHSILEVPAPPKLQRPEALVAFAATQQVVSDADNATWLKTLSHPHRVKRDKTKRKQPQAGSQHEGPPRRPWDDDE